jgi:hypothetical protein
LKIKSTSLLIAGALFGAAVMPAHASNEAMMDLLKVLRDRGTITSQDYELLANAAKADKEAGEAVAMKVDKVEKKSSSFSNLEWAERIKIKGDMRFRHETVRTDSTSGHLDSESEDRLRIRARIGVYAQVNDTTKAGFRFVTTGKDGGLGSNDSTNESLDEDFKTRNLGIDLAYIDWAPSALGGNTNFIFGKMKQPWAKVNSLVWDGDTNPEGMAVKSKFNVGGISLVPSAGYYTLDDISNTSFSDEQHLIHAQLAANIGKKTQVGVSFYGYEDETRAGTLSDPVEERLVEIFGQTAIPGTPITAYASFVDNQNDNPSGVEGDEEAWAIGAKAKMGNFKFGYEYRDHGINALNDNFNNSDTLDDGEGSIFKVGYKIDKNFSIGATYYDMESNISNANLGASDIEDLKTLHLDLKAKF